VRGRLDHAEKEWEIETGIPGSREGVVGEVY